MLPTGKLAITVALYGIDAAPGAQPVTPPVSLRGMTNVGTSRVTLTLPPMLIPPPIDIAMLYSHHMQGMFIVLDAIFQTNVATIDGSSQSLDIAGVSIAI